MASELEYVIYLFLFYVCEVFLDQPRPKSGLTGASLDHFDVNFVRAGAAFNLYRHERSLPLFLFSLRLLAWRYGHAD